jgi:transcriptional regulator with XRE-family HTH domain
MLRRRKSAVVVGRIVRQARKERRMTQQQVAARAGLSREFISEVERGRKSASVYTLMRLAWAMKVTSAELMARVEREAV